jgi:hypothetical protein
MRVALPFLLLLNLMTKTRYQEKYWFPSARKTILYL